MSFRGYVSSAQVMAAGSASAGICVGLLGLLEAIYYAPGNIGAMIYGFGVYALAGMFYGWVCAVFSGGKARTSQYTLSKWTGRVAAWSVGTLILVAWGFLVYRDIWNESITKAGFTSWMIMLLVPVAAIAGVLVAKKLASFLAGKAEAVIVVVLPLALMGVVLGRAVDKRPEASMEPIERKNDQRPPIIFVVVDALRTDASSTPHLEAFAKEAVVFTNAWAAASWTRPSVASLFSGLYPSSHQTIYKTDRFPDRLPCLAALLKGVGYTTVASVTNVNLAPIFGLGRGFDKWSYLPPEPFILAPSSARRLFLVEVYRLLKLRFFPGRREANNYYAEGERVLDQGKELMQPLAKASVPFFAYLHFMEPHDPYFAHPYDGRAVARVENPNPPVEKADEFFDLYRREVQHWDGLFGKLTEYLKRSGLYQKSLIVVTSDHGEEFADHGGFWHGTSLYQELIHVPLIIRFPEGVGAGTQRTEPVSLVDLMPTALETAGVEHDLILAGSSLSGASIAEERPLFAEVDHQGCIMSSVRKGGWKLIQANLDNPRDQPAIQLYNLLSDPEEQINLADQEPDRVAELKRALEKGLQLSSQEAQEPVGEMELDSETQEQLRSLGYTE